MVLIKLGINSLLILQNPLSEKLSGKESINLDRSLNCSFKRGSSDSDCKILHKIPSFFPLFSTLSHEIMDRTNIY